MNDNTLSRRVVLRGVLAAGCGVWVPVVLTGCDSKQPANSTAAPPAEIPPPAATPSAPAAAKVPQSSVQYQTQPKGDQKCAVCAHFIAESNSCKLVDGPIDRQGWCTLWASKA